MLESIFKKVLEKATQKHNLGEPLVNFEIWGNHRKFRSLGEPMGRAWGHRHSAAFKKLSKNPLKLRLVREWECHTLPQWQSVEHQNGISFLTQLGTHVSMLFNCSEWSVDIACVWFGLFSMWGWFSVNGNIEPRAYQSLFGNVGNYAYT